MHGAAKIHVCPLLISLITLLLPHYRRLDFHIKDDSILDASEKRAFVTVEKVMAPKVKRPVHTAQSKSGNAINGSKYKGEPLPGFGVAAEDPIVSLYYPMPNR